MTEPADFHPTSVESAAMSQMLAAGPSWETGAASSSTELAQLKEECSFLRQTVEAQAKLAEEKETATQRKHQEDMANFEAMLNKRMDEKLQQHSEENRAHLSAIMDEKLQMTFDAAAAHTSKVVQNSQKEITESMNMMLSGFLTKLDLNKGKARRGKKTDAEMPTAPETSSSSSSDDDEQTRTRGQKRTKGK